MKRAASVLIVTFALLAGVTPAHADHQPPATVVHCTGAFTMTAGVNPVLAATLVAVAHDHPSMTCVAPGITAGGYHVGDHVYRGHLADGPTLAACYAMWPDDQPTQRECVRLAACESGSLANARVISKSRDWGRWQHHLPYIPARLAAIGHPDGDPLDLWINALMTRWYWGERGGSFTGSSGWSCGALIGAR